MVEASELELKDLDYQEMLLYLQLNLNKVTNIGYIRGFLPSRAKSKGRKPTMRNKQVRAPSHQSKVEETKQIWIHKAVPEGKHIRRRIVAKVIEIGINVLFNTFAYTFGGKLYHQFARAPIGTRVRCAVANLLMEWLLRKMETIF